MRLKQSIPRLFLLISVFCMSQMVMARHYIYIVDKSGSMKKFKEEVVKALSESFESQAIGAKAFYREGDFIHLWAFDVGVYRLIDDLPYQQGREKELCNRMVETLQNLQMGKDTNIEQPLRLALDGFKGKEKGQVAIFLYTDGQESVSQRSFDEIRSLFNKHYKDQRRLDGMFVVHFGDAEPPEGLTSLIQAMGGRVVKPSEVPSISPQQLQEQQKAITIRVTPAAGELQVTRSVSAALSFPFAFALESDDKRIPTVPVDLDFTTSHSQYWKLTDQALNLKKTTETISLNFITSDLAPGEYAGLLRVKPISSHVKVLPAQIPMKLRVLPPKPGLISIHFQPLVPPRQEMIASGEWEEVKDLILLLQYASDLAETRVSFECPVPDGLELQCHAAKDVTRTVPLGNPVRLADVGSLVEFRVRQVPEKLKTEDVSLSVGVRLQSGTNAQFDGQSSVIIPLRFSLPVLITGLTRQIDLGALPRSTGKVRRILEIQVQGDPAGASLRLVKTGQGLAGLAITPSEIALQTGRMSLDVDFSNFEDVVSSDIAGQIEITPGKNAGRIRLGDAVTQVKGSILAAVPIATYIESDLVVGVPMVIHARFPENGRGEITCEITKPGDKRATRLELFDDASSSHGDKTAGDGEYSNIFTDTSQLGVYKMLFRGKGPAQGVEDKEQVEPVLLRLPSKPLTIDQIALPRLKGALTLPFEVYSDNTGDVSIQCASPEVRNSDGQRLQVSLSPTRLGKGAQILLLKVSFPEKLPNWKWQEFSVPVVIGPVQERTGHAELLLRFRCVPVWRVWLGRALMGIVGGLALIAVWVFVVAPLARAGQLKAASRISLLLDDGIAYDLASLCRRNRWKSLGGMFSLQTRCAFGQPKKAEVQLFERYMGIDGLLFPGSDGSCQILAFNRVVVKKQDGSSKTILEPGQKGKLSTNGSDIVLLGETDGSVASFSLTRSGLTDASDY